MEHEPWIFIALCCLALLVPLAYAGATLLGMQGKRYVPLLRMRDAEGATHMLISPVVLHTHPSLHRRFLWSPLTMS